MALEALEVGKRYKTFAGSEATVCGHLLTNPYMDSPCPRSGWYVGYIKGHGNSLFYWSLKHENRWGMGEWELVEEWREPIKRAVEVLLYRMKNDPEHIIHTLVPMDEAMYTCIGSTKALVEEGKFTAYK
jgi:hypothetical protein